MIDLRSGRYALGVCVAAAFLAGCGGHASNGVVPGGIPDSLPHHKTFNFTGGAQEFKVPAGVRQLNVVARGAKGAGSFAGHGGRVHAVIPVTPGEKLVVYVGGDASGVNGGFNGGANGGASFSGSPTSYGGGGASDLRQHGDRLADRILVSGGGGGQGGGWPASGGPGGDGGKGGGRTGGSGGDGVSNYSSYSAGQGGEGGTQHVGGSGGLGTDCIYTYSGANGMLGAGGAGGAGEIRSGSFGGPGGGGGGGGYYGGGGGGDGGNYEGPGLCAASGGGGGGGSSYAEPGATSVHMWQGWKNATGNGLVVLSW